MKLATQQQLDRAYQFACTLLKQGPVDWACERWKDSKSREQEEKYHAIIGEIAASRTFYGKRLPAESWKRLLIDAFKHETEHNPDLADAWRKFGKVENLPALNHPGFVMVGVQSRKFGVKLAGAFIEWLEAFDATADTEVTNG